MMEVGNGGMTIEEYRTHMTLWVILAAPLLVGNDPRTMTNDIKELLLNREVLAVNQDTLGKQGRRLIRNGTTEIWAKPLSGEAVAVALFNRGASRTQVSVRWSELGLNGQYKARDLWKRLDLPDATNSYSAEVPSRSMMPITTATTKIPPMAAAASTSGRPERTGTRTPASNALMIQSFSAAP